MEIIREGDVRYYVPLNKQKLISVTSVINQMYIPKGLQYWLKTTSEEDRRLVQTKSFEIGNTFHENVEKFIKKEDFSLKEYEVFFLNKLNLENTKTEVPFCFSNSKLGYGGTIDCLSSDLVIDWKTTKKKKYPSQFLTYCLQLSAYCKVVNLSKSLIVFNDYVKETFYIYELDKTKLNFYFEEFSKMLYDFYNETTFFNSKMFEEKSKGYKATPLKL